MIDDCPNRGFAWKVVERLRTRLAIRPSGGRLRPRPEPADYDVATSATPEEVMNVLPYRSVPVGISFGVVPGARTITASRLRSPPFRSDGAYRERPATRVGRLRLTRSRRRPGGSSRSTGCSSIP